MGELDASHRGHAIGQHAREGFGAFGGNGNLFRLRLGRGNHLSQTLEARAGAGRKHEGAAAHQADRHEVFVGVIGQALEGECVGHHRCRGGVEEGVAVGRGARRRLRTDHVLPTGAVFHHDGLAQTG